MILCYSYCNKPICHLAPKYWLDGFTKRPKSTNNTQPKHGPYCNRFWKAHTLKYKWKENKLVYYVQCVQNSICPLSWGPKDRNKGQDFVSMVVKLSFPWISSPAEMWTELNLFTVMRPKRQEPVGGFCEHGSKTFVSMNFITSWRPSTC